MDFCRSTVDFSCAFESSLQAKKGFTPRYYFEYSACIAEVQRRREIWWDLLWAKNDTFCRRERMKSLKELRIRLGEEDYWAGKMPFPVPLGICTGE